MATAERREVLPARPAPLSSTLDRELYLIIDGYWPDGQAEPLDGLAEAIARWIFDRDLLMVPHGYTIDNAPHFMRAITREGAVRRVDAPARAQRPPRIHGLVRP